MTANGFIQLALYVTILLLCAKPLGIYMARVYRGQGVGIDRLLGGLERGLYRLTGVRPQDEMSWKAYAMAMLGLNLAGILVVYALQRLQGVLPWNPQGLPGVTPHSSFNTAISFGSNTNWQGYGGETTMSYLTQMLGLTVQNFVSAATGMATLAAFVRGLARQSVETIGNFWVDLTRSTLYVLLPLSIVLALVLVSQGVIQNLSPYAKVAVIQPTLYSEPATDAQEERQVGAVGLAVAVVVGGAVALAQRPLAAGQVVDVLLAPRHQPARQRHVLQDHRGARADRPGESRQAARMAAYPAARDRPGAQPLPAPHVT